MIPVRLHVISPQTFPCTSAMACHRALVGPSVRRHHGPSVGSNRAHSKNVTIAAISIIDLS